MVGRGGQSYLVIGDGTDILLGVNGNDVFDGGEGNDILIGGKGADRFVLQLGDEQGKILAYRPREDFFVLEGLTFEQLIITQGNFSTSIKVTDTQERLAELITREQTDMIGAQDFVVLA